MISTENAIRKSPSSLDEWSDSGVSVDIFSINVLDLNHEESFEAICEESLNKLGSHAKQYCTKERKFLEERAAFLESGGWWVSGLDPFNQWKRMEWGQFKPNTPRKDNKGKIIKYESPWKTECRAIFLDNGIQDYWPYTIANMVTKEPIVICEGAKKAALLLSAGYPAIALPGITMGYRKQENGELKLIRELEILQNRTIIICFDQDSKKRTRDAVENATQNLRQLLSERGCEVKSTSWDFRKGKGIDDLGKELLIEQRYQLVRQILTDALPVEIPNKLPPIEDLRNDRLPLLTIAAQALSYIPIFKQGEGRYIDLIVMMSGIIRDLGDDGRRILKIWDKKQGDWGMPFTEKLKTIEAGSPTLASLFFLARRHGWAWPSDQFRTQWERKTLENLQGDEPDCKNTRLYKYVEKILGGVLRWNELKYAIECDGVELEQDSLRMTLALDYGLQIESKELATEICFLIAKKNSYHPVVNYFNAVAKKHSPEETAEVLDTIAAKYLHADGELYSQYLRKWLIAVVARVFQPGCKMDTVLTLQGGQGTFKSTFFKKLCFDEEWFDDSFTGQISDKDEKLKFHVSLIAEWAELDQIFLRRDAAACKNTLTSSTDKIRPPYGAKVKSYPRRSVVVSTINPSDFLNDPTGDRRWWVVPVTQAIDNDGVENDRDLIWAAAVHAYRTGEKWHLSPEMEILRAESNKRFQNYDVWQELIGGWIANRFDPSEPFTSLQILTECLNIPAERCDRAAQNRVGAVLSRLGYSNDTRICTPGSKERPRVWIKITKEDGSDGSSAETPTPSEDNHDPSSNHLLKEVERMDRKNEVTIHDPSDPSSFLKFPEDQKNSSDPERLDHPQIQKGDRVIPQGKARWIRKGSQPLPKYLVPRGLSEAEEIAIGAIDGDLFHDLTSISRVIEVSADGQRIKVMSANGRKSVFPIEDVVLFQKGVE